MNDFMKKTLEFVEDYKSVKIDLSQLAGYLGEDKIVIEEAKNYELTLNLVDMVLNQEIQYYVDEDVNEYLEDKEQDIMFEFIEEDVYECARYLRDIEIYEEFEKFKNDPCEKKSMYDLDLCFGDYDDIGKVLSGEIELCDLDDYDELHEGFDSYMYSGYSYDAVKECIKKIFEIKQDITNIVMCCKNELLMEA